MEACHVSTGGVILLSLSLSLFLSLEINPPHPVPLKIYPFHNLFLSNHILAPSQNSSIFRHFLSLSFSQFVLPQRDSTHSLVRLLLHVSLLNSLSYVTRNSILCHIPKEDLDNGHDDDVEENVEENEEENEE